MSRFYKIYVGKFVDRGTPDDLTITGQVPRKRLVEHCFELARSVKRDAEIYIFTPEGDVHAFFRETLDIKWRKFVK